MPFEGIAKTNTTNTHEQDNSFGIRLRVLLKQIQQTQKNKKQYFFYCLRVLLKQIQHTNSDQSIDRVHKF